MYIKPITKYRVGLELFFSHFPGKIDGAAFITTMAQSCFVVLLKQIVPAQVNQKKYGWWSRFTSKKVLLCSTCFACSMGCLNHISSRNSQCSKVHQAIITEFCLCQMIGGNAQGHYSGTLNLKSSALPFFMIDELLSFGKNVHARIQRVQL